MERKITTDAGKLAERIDETDVKNGIKDVEAAILDLKDTMGANASLLCLSAPQIGLPMRIFAMRFGDGIRTFINPMISKREGFMFATVSCPEYGNREYIFPCSSRIIGIYQKDTGAPEQNQFSDEAAGAFQYMTNLLDGAPMGDYGLQIDDDFKKASKDEQDEVLKAFMDSLKSRSDILQKEIAGSKSLSDISKGIEFMRKIQTGEVKTELMLDSSKLNRAQRRFLAQEKAKKPDLPIDTYEPKKG